MSKLHNYSTWKKINEKENSELFSIFSSMTKAIGSAIISPLTSLIVLYVEMFNKKPERVSIIFPKEGWETKAVNLLKKLGVVTGVFKSTNEAIQSLKTLKDKGVKVKELVIGSHGDGKNLLITQKEDRNAKKYAPELLKNAKEIITKDSKVFFTACYGADYLTNLVDSANKLGVGVYGSRGVYNYITNTSEKGYYYCKPYQIPKPKKKTEPRDEFYPGNLEIKIGKYSIEFEFFGSFGKNPKIKIEFNPSIFSDLGWQLKSKEPLSFILLDSKIDIDEKDYGTKEGENVYSYSFYLDESDFEYEKSLKDIGFTQLSKLLSKGDFKWPDSKKKNFINKLKKYIQKGDVKLSIGDLDLSKERPKIRGYRVDEITFDNNEHLIECGACKKVSEPPISWISPKSI